MIFKLADFILDKLFFHFPTLKQFFKFSFVGGFNSIVDFSVYFFLTRGLDWFGRNYLIANALAFIGAITCSFFLNNHWTFKDRRVKPELPVYLRYVGLSLFTLAIIEVILYYLISNLGVFDLFAKLGTLVISAILNFSLARLWIFKKVQ